MPHRRKHGAIAANQDDATSADDFKPLEDTPTDTPAEFWQEVLDIMKPRPRTKGADSTAERPTKFRTLRPCLPPAPAPLLQPADLLAKREGPLRFKLAKCPVLSPSSQPTPPPVPTMLDHLVAATSHPQWRS
ncbi:Aste57867_1769 [Aphanomyces stellatus]|uniref:Aste57867_1769 protein n=1 Tax=Aphanomyces stellatus TaxID=120398 RepID=A0A485K8L8_9STRA|nr:hypothetical protein As57867_001767 [Aphanomyces stellatus]VFT78978.1 Aste57867_1769 [Aphanomyces stellatus]